ncbi:TPA: GlxA family transcriptional regulator [Pseudomonas aeruginosa]|uniref:GlxA family transcriptional regulator n=4 Tax=Pseudomonas aeruginosa TaxID=287 RepID=UPI001F2DAA36|nr:helix-turn-helix domain-containing protein [Pseudomonas aeruginosa]MDF5967333.1 helix-turn-helix domain-containing protein [Pseudomonas aeruginosa]MDF5979488.1 helix-turn-helix domain-containing protein [Pseudomonas aeruginosa]MDI3686347.1 helix-turn-helix domain-containing protein [Pseudomonas aeruginosa]MDP5978664.1 helix-turn-helix domain-containing protein [Pseudomonas aeruginosa]MDY1501434.1 helix-turn-helix domain-containing protein [Pseudomonas aeruginosa]
MKEVAVLAYDGCWGMGVFAVADFFRIVSLLEAHIGLEPSFRVRILASAREVTVASGHSLRADAILEIDADCDLLVIPAIEGARLAGFVPDAASLAWIAQRIDAGARVLALTTGAAWLAASRRADGLLLASHWAYVRQLARCYPQCRFIGQRSYLQADGLYTTGSLGGCFDALLEIIARERGDRFSQLCATHLLVADAQRLSPILPGRRNHRDESILALQDWIEANHAEPLGLERMAAQAGLALRTLKRRFGAATGLSPIRYLQQVRVDRAKKLLLATPLSIREIAYEVGYENVSFFVRLFRKEAGDTPSHWRGRVRGPER